MNYSRFKCERVIMIEQYLLLFFAMKKNGGPLGEGRAVGFGDYGRDGRNTVAVKDSGFCLGCASTLDDS